MRDSQVNSTLFNNSHGNAHTPRVLSNVWTGTKWPIRPHLTSVLSTLKRPAVSLTHCRECQSIAGFNASQNHVKSSATSREVHVLLNSFHFNGIYSIAYYLFTDCTFSSVKLLTDTNLVQVQHLLQRSQSGMLFVSRTPRKHELLCTNMHKLHLYTTRRL